jgi:hypothetical protein
MARQRTSVLWKMPSDEFRKLIREAKTYKEILLRFGLKNKGGNHRTLKKRMREEGVDGSHLPKNFVAMISYNQGRKIPLENILVRGSDYCRRNLKRRLLASGLIKNVCEVCGNKGKWRGKSLVLILDHRNGVSDDNRKENLRMVCPNCNSQLDTFAGRNRRSA